MDNTTKRINFDFSEKMICDLDRLQAAHERAQGGQSKTSLVRAAVEMLRQRLEAQKFDLSVTAGLDAELARRGIPDAPNEEPPKDPEVAIIGGGILGVFVAETINASLKSNAFYTTVATTRIITQSWLHTPRIELPAIQGIQTQEDLFALGDEKFEELLMDRFSAMGFWVTKVGKTRQPDGGIDFFFESFDGPAGNQIIGAAQVKHYSRSDLKFGVDVVRDMAGIMQRNFGRLNLGMVITNTSFTEEAEWFAKPIEVLLRLRQDHDAERWANGDFSNALERREFPANFQVTRNLSVDLRRGLVPQVGLSVWRERRYPFSLARQDSARCSRGKAGRPAASPSSSAVDHPLDLIEQFSLR